MKTDRVILSTTMALVAAALLLGTSPGWAAGAKTKAVSKDIIAVQIRRQGFECKNPESAEHDDQASKPDAEVWVLKCQGVTYKVKLIPNMAATVEKLPDDQQNSQKP